MAENIKEAIEQKNPIYKTFSSLPRGKNKLERLTSENILRIMSHLQVRLEHALHAPLYGLTYSLLPEKKIQCTNTLAYFNSTSEKSFVIMAAAAFEPLGSDFSKKKFLIWKCMRWHSKNLLRISYDHYLA